MSKNKKVKSALKSVSKPNHEKLKGVNKHKKQKIKQSKMKNIQNIRDSVLSRSKSKQNIKDNVMSKSKNKHKHTIKNTSVPSTKKNTSIKNNLNVNKLNAMLNAKEGKTSLKTKEKVNSQEKMKKNPKFNKKLNVNKLNAMLNAKESEVDPKTKKKEVTNLSLRDRMLKQLKASRFRFLNEQMYSRDSSESKKYFQDDPHAFHAYHEGYKQQVERWPVNPLDVIIEAIKKMPKDHVIADFGCGEAKLADSVPQTVHSFDLVAVNDKVKACDMAHTPLLTGRVNVVVFCLSLMGSNLRDYLLEANRVLDKNGILKIAEVESRFDKIDDFIKLMSLYGFVNTWKDLSNNLFYFMDFKKTKDVLKKDANKLPVVSLKPCLYKKR